MSFANPSAVGRSHLFSRHPELVSGPMACPRIRRSSPRESRPWMLKHVQHDDGGEGVFASSIIAKKRGRQKRPLPNVLHEPRSEALLALVKIAIVRIGRTTV